MWYYFSMNKDVVYIEPEDDITDIITKIENSKQKIVALVPPKKAGVFRSIVNIKLITKAGTSSGKTVVIVTTDPSIIKLAAATKLPVTKNLQSAPVIPELKDGEIEVESHEAVNEDGTTDKSTEDEASSNEAESAEEADVANTEDTEDTDETEPERDKAKAEPSDKKSSSTADSKKSAKGKLANSANPFLRWVGTHKKLCIAGGVGIVGLIIFAIWAFLIAPAVTVTLELRATTGRFSENITLTDTLANENVDEGRFYYTEKKIENKSTVEFEATGEKNVGKKASGSVVVYEFFKKEGSSSVNAGTTFTVNGLKYISTKDVTISYNGDGFSKCDNKDNSSSIMNSGCQISARVPVEAAESGAKYNIAATNSGWSTNAQVNGVYSDAAMSGGTDETIKVVLQSDIDKAMTEIQDSDESTNKETLLDSIEDGEFVIESSFQQTTSEAVSTPAVDEEVKEGEKAKLTMITTDSILVIDETKVKEFIQEKAKLADNDTIYSMNDPFVENFTKTDTGYAGKLKTSYVSGPKVTENDVIDMIKGKGLGSAQHDLNTAYSGIKSITMDTSVPWVMSVPNNPEKITVIIKSEE